MKSCPENEKLIAYCLKLLEPSEFCLIEEHLKICLNCQKKLEIERALEKELSIPLEPGNIENMVLQKYRISKEFQTAGGIKFLFRQVLNSLLVIAITTCLGILFSIFWVELFPVIEKVLFLRLTPEKATLFSMVFLIACLVFAYRRRLLKFI